MAAWAKGRPSRSDVGAQEKEWTELWRIEVPSKVLVFLWRLASISISTGDVHTIETWLQMGVACCVVQLICQGML